MSKKIGPLITITGDGQVSDNDVDLSNGLDLQLQDVSIEEDVSEITTSKGRSPKKRMTTKDVVKLSTIKVGKLKRGPSGDETNRSKASRMQDGAIDHSRKKGVRMFRTQVIQDFGEKTLGNGMVVRHLWPVQLRVEVFKEVKVQQPLSSIPSSNSDSHESNNREPLVASDMNSTERIKMAKYFSNPDLSPPESPFGKMHTLSAGEDYVSKETKLAITHHLSMRPIQNSINDVKIFDRTLAKSAVGKFRQNVLFNQQLKTQKTSVTPHSNLSKFEQVMADFTGQNPRMSPPRLRKSIELESTQDTAQKVLFKRSQSKVSNILQKYKHQFPQAVSEMDSQQKKNWMENHRKKQQNRKGSFSTRHHNQTEQNFNCSSALDSNNQKSIRKGRNLRSKVNKTIEPPALQPINEKNSLAFQISAGRNVDEQNYKQKFFRIFEQSIKNRLQTTNQQLHFKTLASSFDAHNSKMEPMQKSPKDDKLNLLLSQVKKGNKNYELKRLLDETSDVNANEARDAHEIFEAEALVRFDSLQFKQNQILKFQKKHIRRDMIPKSDLPEPNSVFGQLKKNIMNLISK